MNWIILYIACAAIFFALDGVWLTLMGQRFYRRHLGALMREKPNLLVAAGFYLVYVAGLVILVAGPAEGDVGRALLLGAVFGLVAYGTYDLTNLSTLNKFSNIVAAVDMAWGTFLSAVAAGGGVWLAGLLG